MKGKKWIIFIIIYFFSWPTQVDEALAGRWFGSKILGCFEVVEEKEDDDYNGLRAYLKNNNDKPIGM